MISGGGLSVLLLWLPCLLFVLHDLEETLFLKSWLHRNREWFLHRFPALAQRLLPHFERISTQRFAFMAAEELALLAGATVYAQLSGNYELWLAFFLAFTIHLVIHIVQWCAVRRYVPVVATSLLCLPVCLWMLSQIENSRLFTVREFVLCGLFGAVAAAVNLWLLHRFAGKIIR